jgi:inner membrane protein
MFKVNTKIRLTDYFYITGIKWAFTDGYYTVSQAGGQELFNIVRSGQIQGWQTKDAPFVLSYPLGTKGNENMIIQKGRLAGWNSRSVRRYLERMIGR